MVCSWTYINKFPTLQKPSDLVASQLQRLLQLSCPSLFEPSWWELIYQSDHTNLRVQLPPRKKTETTSIPELIHAAKTEMQWRPKWRKLVVLLCPMQGSWNMTPTQKRLSQNWGIARDLKALGANRGVYGKCWCFFQVCSGIFHCFTDRLC